MAVQNFSETILSWSHDNQEEWKYGNPLFHWLWYRHLLTQSITGFLCYYIAHFSENFCINSLHFLKTPITCVIRNISALIFKYETHLRVNMVLFFYVKNVIFPIFLELMKVFTFTPVVSTKRKDKFLTQKYFEINIYRII